MTEPVGESRSARIGSEGPAAKASARIRESSSVVVLARWDCGHIGIDDGQTHECDGRDVCSGTEVRYMPRDEYERDLIASAQRSAETRSALIRATACIRDARSKLTPGMRAGTAEACGLLDQGGDAAESFLAGRDRA